MMGADQQQAGEVWFAVDGAHADACAALREARYWGSAEEIEAAEARAIQASKASKAALAAWQAIVRANIEE